MTLEEKIQAIMEGKDPEVIPAAATSNAIETPAVQFDNNQVTNEKPESEIDDPTKGDSDEENDDEEPVVSLENPLGVNNSEDDLDSDEDPEKEHLEEAIITDGHWKMINGDLGDHTSATMFRAKGKTWPTFTHNPKIGKIVARDDNGRNPSPSVSTSDISVSGLKSLLNKHISKPHPSDETLQKFIDHVTGKNILQESFVVRDGKVSAEAVIKLAKEMFPDQKIKPEHLEAAKNHILKNVTEDKLEEMAMDKLKHPTHGDLSWENNGGEHQIKKAGRVVFKGSHEEVAKRWGAIKKSIEESIALEEDIESMLAEATSEEDLRKMREKQRQDFEEANKKVHNVESEWHHPILTKYGFTPEQKTGVGFLRSYTYTHPDGHVITMSTGLRGDTWEDNNVDREHKYEKNTGWGYHASLEDKLKSMTSPVAEELLAADANLTEEYKAKAKELFESEVQAKVEEARQILESEYAEKLAKVLEEVDAEKKEFINTISEHIDSHLEKVSEQWVVENKVAIETNIQVENAQSLMNGLRSLFEQHNLILPEGGRDVVQELQNQVDSLTEELKVKSVQLEEGMAKLTGFERNEILNEVCKGLTELDQSRLKALVEDVEFTDTDSFKEKVKTLRENVFVRQQKQEISESFIGDSQVKTRSPVMQAYLDALTGKRK